MSKLTQTFTDKLFADYQANTKFSAIENAVTHNGLLKSLETRQSEIENDYVFSIDLTKDEVSNQKQSETIRTLLDVCCTEYISS